MGFFLCTYGYFSTSNGVFQLFWKREYVPLTPFFSAFHNPGRVIFYLQYAWYRTKNRKPLCPQQIGSKKANGHMSSLLTLMKLLLRPGCSPGRLAMRWSLSRAQEISSPGVTDCWRWWQYSTVAATGAKGGKGGWTKVLSSEYFLHVKATACFRGNLSPENLLYSSARLIAASKKCFCRIPVWWSKTVLFHRECNAGPAVR